MSEPHASPETAGITDDESGRLRDLVEAIREGTHDLARAHARLVRYRSAVMAIALEQVARSSSRASRERELPVRSIALEIAAATKAHDLTVQKELGEAHCLTEKFAATVEALESGRIGVRHAQAILDTGTVLDDDDTRRAWEQVVIARAERDSPGRVRAFARELAESVHPVGMSERHARAAVTRGVSVRDLADGMAELSVILPATVAYGIRDRLRRQAEAIRASSHVADDPADAVETSSSTGSGRGHGGNALADAVEASSSTGSGPHLGVEAPAVESRQTDEDGCSTREEQTTRDARTLAQIGADLCADLLLTAAPTIDPTTDATCPGGLGAIRAQVQITVPVLTLLGQADAGATVAGRTPIDPESARHLAAHAPGWDRVLVDPIIGTVLEVDRYSPTASQRRYLAARDQHCRAPGCRAPVSRCQLDHNHEAQHGGPTKLSNLCHLCVRHHTLKTETAWTVTQESDGTLLFQKPAGTASR